MKYRIEYALISNKGNFRSINEDNYCCAGLYRENGTTDYPTPLCGTAKPEKLLAAVFDGMGGEECGQEASLIAARLFSGLKASKDMEKQFDSFCMKANEEICGFVKKRGLKSSGSTAAMLAFSKTNAHICNIGDSRIYKYSCGRLTQLSKDHIFGVYAGRKPALLQNLGIPAEEMTIEPYTASPEYSENDIFLLCSDGLTDMVKDSRIAEIIGEKPIKEAAQRLLREAMCSGGYDNITLILCKVCRGKSSLKDFLNHLRGKGA